MSDQSTTFLQARLDAYVESNRERLQQYRGGIDSLVALPFRMDARGNAVADLGSVDTPGSPIAEFMRVFMNHHGIGMGGKSLRGAATRAFGEEGVNYLELEAARMIREEFMPHFSGRQDVRTIYPLDTHPTLDLEALHGKVVGNIRVEIDEFDRAVHEKYVSELEHSGRRGVETHRPQALVIHPTDVPALRALGFVVEEHLQGAGNPTSRLDNPPAIDKARHKLEY
jgi:hypothetical protein